jgi:internalin A
MSLEMDTTIRENLNGKYLIIYAHQFKEGIDFAQKNKIPQIQLRGVIGRENLNVVVDFKEMENISQTLRIISFADIIENIINFDSIYSLQNLEKIYILEKQNFEIDVSLFPKLRHLGSEYWKGLLNFYNAKNLTSLVIIKLPDSNLERISIMLNLEILHIYSSKIKSLLGIENLSKLVELSLARNNALEDIQMLAQNKTLKKLEIRKCNKISDYSFLSKLINITKLDVDKLNS